VAIPPIVAVGRLSIASSLQQQKKQLKDSLGQRKDDSGVLVEDGGCFGRLEAGFVLGFLVFRVFLLKERRPLRTKGVLYTHRNRDSESQLYYATAIQDHGFY
jgi:hypothetical protein